MAAAHNFQMLCWALLAVVALLHPSAAQYVVNPSALGRVFTGS